MLCKTKMQARKQGHVPECKCQGGRVQRPLDQQGHPQCFEPQPLPQEAVRSMPARTRVSRISQLLNIERSCGVKIYHRKLFTRFSKKVLLTTIKVSKHQGLGTPPQLSKVLMQGLHLKHLLPHPLKVMCGGGPRDFSVSPVSTVFGDLGLGSF